MQVRALGVYIHSYSNGIYMLFTLLFLLNTFSRPMPPSACTSTCADFRALLMRSNHSDQRSPRLLPLQRTSQHPYQTLEQLILPQRTR